MLTEKDLEALNTAAELVISVIERHRIHEEDASEKRALFQFVEKEKPSALIGADDVQSEQGFVEFTDEEIKQMPKKIQRLIIINRKRCRLRTRPCGKSVTYEIRFRRDGFEVNACGKTIELAKANFIKKMKTAVPKTREDEIDVPATFTAFSLFYFETFRKEKVSAATFRSDFQRWNLYLKPYFKDLPLKKITPFICKKLLDDVKSQGKSKTAEELYSILSVLFKCAIAHGIIERNPLATVPKTKHERESGIALTKEEETILFSHAKGTELETSFALLLYCGLRPNELATVQRSGPFIIAVNSKRKNRKVEYKRIPIIGKLATYLPQEGALHVSELNPLRCHIRTVLPNHRLYDLRTTFYSRCKENNVEDAARDEFVGHSLGKLGNAYTDLSDEYLLKEGKKLENW